MQNKLVPGLGQPTPTYTKDPKRIRQMTRKQWSHTGQNKEPKLLHVCSLVLEKPRNGLDKSFKEGLKAGDSF